MIPILKPGRLVLVSGSDGEEESNFLMSSYLEEMSRFGTRRVLEQVSRPPEVTKRNLGGQKESEAGEQRRERRRRTPNRTGERQEGNEHGSDGNHDNLSNGAQADGSGPRDAGVDPSSRRELG